jgi:hypothetical protein
MMFNNFNDPHPNLPPSGKGNELNEPDQVASLEKDHECCMSLFPLGGNKKGGKKLDKFTLFLSCIFIIAFPYISSAQKKFITFTDITKKAGISFKYTYGDNSYKNIIESSGSGITIFDYNNDGLMDLYLMNGTYLEGISDPSGKVYKSSHNELYKNNGNGTFTEVSQVAGIGGHQWSMAAGAIDLDKDGFQDLYVLNYGPNVFYHNNGNGTFSDITTSLGLAGPDNLNGFTKWSIGVAFLDYNLDGRLDAMVGNFMAFNPAYVSPSTPGMMPSPAEYNGQA